MPIVADQAMDNRHFKYTWNKEVERSVSEDRHTLRKRTLAGK